MQYNNTNKSAKACALHNILTTSILPICYNPINYYDYLKGKMYNQKINAQNETLY